MLGDALYDGIGESSPMSPPEVDHDELHESSDGGIDVVGLLLVTGWILAACVRS